MNFKKMFDDQRSFNQQIFPLELRHDGEQSMDRLRHLALGMVEETLEFLRTYEWKSHRRRVGKLQNIAHSHEELVDMLKYWLSCAELADFPIEDLEQLYYAKSRVVQYRYQEEWLKEISGPCVLVDIDNVLADYITGICQWAANRWNAGSQEDQPSGDWVQRLANIVRNGTWVNAKSVGVSEGDWNVVKHAFRTQGGKRTIPVFADAKPFLEWCQSHNWKIILVTSRPIDRYPNIFTDTLSWLHDNDLPFDHLWWADDKARRLEDYEHVNLRSHVVFAVDDDIRFVNQYLEKNIKTYWLRRQETGGADNLIAHSLTQIIEREGEEDGRLC